ncbi:transcriptional regulator, MerR family [Paenibacillus sp. HGF5]|nr:transcriptional regulator, MerR family [Paenibacillus sp. HGF5]
MKIGELAARTGVSIRSLRYYEQQGLLTPVRNENGYREYSMLAEEQVRTIQLYLNLGLTTEQIAGFLHCVLKNKEAFCAEVFPIFRQKNRRDRSADSPAESYQDESGGTHAIDSG